MTGHRQMKTDRRLWLTLGVVAFVLLGFVDPWGDSIKTHGSVWGYLIHDLGGWEWWRIPLIVVSFAVALSIPAAVLGWVAQAVVVFLRTDRSPEPPAHPPS